MMETNQSGRPAQRMSYNDSVTNCLINNYVGFSGRASRSEYWFWILFTFVTYFITGIIDGFLFGWEVTDPQWVSNAFEVILFLPGLSVAVRRLHDVGKSGWWLLSSILILPVLLLIYWTIIEGDFNPNEYGEVPTNKINQSNSQVDYNNY